MDSISNYTNINIAHNDLILEKIQSYDAIKIETERLLKREQTLFMINSIVTIGLLITLFKML